MLDLEQEIRQVTDENSCLHKKLLSLEQVGSCNEDRALRLNFENEFNEFKLKLKEDFEKEKLSLAESYERRLKELQETVSVLDKEKKE